MSASITRQDKRETNFFALYCNELWDVDVNDGELVFYGPVDVALGYISLQAQGQRLYSARL